MSDFTAVDAAITAIANEVVKKAITKTRVADVLTLLRNHISEIELTPGQNAEVRVNGTIFQWKLSGANTWTNLFDLSALQGEDGNPGPYFLFRVFNNEVIQIRLSNAAEADPWINLVFLEDITGPQGSPDTPAQIVAKLESISVEEDKIQTTAIGGFDSAVTAKVNEVAPEIDPAAEQFSITAAPGNQLFLKNIFVATLGNQITYDANRRFGSALAPLLGNLTQSLVGAAIGTRQLIYHRQTVAPTFPLTWVVTSGTYGTGPTDLNIILVDYHADDLQTVNILTVTYGEPPILENIILHLKFEEAPTPATLADSSGNNVVVNILNQGQGIVSVAAPVDLGIGLGNLTDNAGTIARVVSDADTQLISTAFTIAFWAMIPVGVSGLTGNWFDSSDNYTENGIRIKNISDGRMEIYLNNIGAENTANRLRITGNNMAADNIFVHWCFVYDGTNLTVFRNNVQVGTTTALSGRNVSNTNDWYLNGTIAGGGNRKCFDDLFVLPRAINATERTILYNRGL